MGKLLETPSPSYDPLAVACVLPEALSMVGTGTEQQASQHLTELPGAEAVWLLDSNNAQTIEQVMLFGFVQARRPSAPFFISCMTDVKTCAAGETCQHSGTEAARGLGRPERRGPCCNAVEGAQAADCRHVAHSATGFGHAGGLSGHGTRSEGAGHAGKHACQGS